MQTRENLALQELNYRISVLETFQAFAKDAPLGLKVEDLSYHYQLVDAYIKSVLSERQFGAKTDSNGKNSFGEACTPLFGVRPADGHVQRPFLTHQNHPDLTPGDGRIDQRDFVWATGSCKSKT